MTKRDLHGVYYELFLECLAAFEGAAEGDLVGVLEVYADGKAACQPRNFHWAFAYLLLNIESRGFAFDACIGRENDLLHGIVIYALNELCDVQLGRSNAVYGRNQAAQHMVRAVKGGSFLKRHDIKRLGYHGDNGFIALWVTVEWRDCDTGIDKCKRFWTVGDTLVK